MSERESFHFVFQEVVYDPAMRKHIHSVYKRLEQALQPFEVEELREVYDPPLEYIASHDYKFAGVFTRPGEIGGHLRLEFSDQENAMILFVTDMHERGESQVAEDIADLLKWARQSLIPLPDNALVQEMALQQSSDTP